MIFPVIPDGKMTTLPSSRPGMDFHNRATIFHEKGSKSQTMSHIGVPSGVAVVSWSVTVFLRESCKVVSDGNKEMAK